MELGKVEAPPQLGRSRVGASQTQVGMPHYPLTSRGIPNPPPSQRPALSPRGAVEAPLPGEGRCPANSYPAQSLPIASPREGDGVVSPSSLAFFSPAPLPAGLLSLGRSPEGGCLRCSADS